jgi:hypothetical protein
MRTRLCHDNALRGAPVAAAIIRPARKPVAGFERGIEAGALSANT